MPLFFRVDYIMSTITFDSFDKVYNIDYIYNLFIVLKSLVERKFDNLNKSWMVGLHFIIIIFLKFCGPCIII